MTWATMRQRHVRQSVIATPSRGHGLGRRRRRPRVPASAHGQGTPPRGATLDKRLADMPEDLSRSQVSAYIAGKYNLNDAMWAHADAVYAVPTSFGFLENEFVVEAIEATSRYLLPGSLKSDPENAPKYTPPKRGRLAGPMLKASLATTSDDLVATQSIEAQSYGISELTIQLHRRP